MDDIVDFGHIILVVSGALSIAIVVRVVAARIGLPTAALLLTVAAVSGRRSPTGSRACCRSRTSSGSQRWR